MCMYVSECEWVYVPLLLIAGEGKNGVCGSEGM